jgi:hypothetical protein
MKTMILALVATTISAAVINTNVNAQSTNKDLALNRSFHLSVPLAGSELSTNKAATSISANAIKNFSRSFKGITGATWSQAKDGGVIASFTSDNVKNRIAYNSKGREQYKILTYDESKLSREMKRNVQSAYEDFNITQVDEVHFENETVYLVHLENCNRIKMVRIHDGEMEEVQNLKKG